ncbi:hypothetical protein [Altericroceibacterium endophyticum]|uniref:Uncharacterized protein n=1 Tax=Altericroceibacterium endophyticum TaxID=1808508 RepID=A0A6I4T0Y1_9SPHN|nr:hypothetical protein [Altericroceibacterium endophyticum]MXO64804.1 hypothetical protein [Altericroceibacterium endophyticum]
MSSKHTIRAVKALKVYCPVDRPTMDLLMRGQLPADDQSSALATILDLVRADNPLGDFGAYKSVVELATGLETFVPGHDAHPTLGQAGATEVSLTAILTIYIPADAPEDSVERVIDKIVAAHPWEVPVIEISETALVTRI